MASAGLVLHGDHPRPVHITWRRQGRKHRKDHAEGLEFSQVAEWAGMLVEHADTLCMVVSLYIAQSTWASGTVLDVKQEFIYIYIYCCFGLSQYANSK